MARPVIIIHGAYLHPDHYEPLARLLREHTDTVILPDIGRMSLASATSRVQSVVDELPQPPVVVAHSWGGATAGGVHGVAHLVFLDAFVLDVGETAAELLALDEGAEEVATFMAALRPSDDGSTYTVDPSLAGDLFFNGCDPATIRRGVALLRPELAANFNARPVAAAWRHGPSLYIRYRGDRTFPPSLARMMAARCGETLEIAGGHLAFYSQPADVAERVRHLV